jgi:hypothetical protein
VPGQVQVEALIADPFVEDGLEVIHIPATVSGPTMQEQDGTSLSSLLITDLET